MKQFCNKHLKRFRNMDDEQIIPHMDEIRKAMYELMTTNQDFIDSVEIRTSNEDMVMRRFRMWLDKLNDIVTSEKNPRFFSTEIKEMLYNEDSKRIPGFENGTLPDLIIHKGGSNKDNKVIIECKTWWNNDIYADMQKLKEFINIRGKYKFKYGISIIFKMDTIEMINNSYLEPMEEVMKSPLHNPEQKEFLKLLEDLRNNAEKMEFIFEGEVAIKIKEFMLAYAELLMELYKYRILIDKMSEYAKSYPVVDINKAAEDMKEIDCLIVLKI